MHCTEKKNQQWEHAHNRPTMSWLFQLFGCLRATEFIYASCNFLLMRHLTFWIAAQPKQTGMKRKAKRIKKEANWEKSKYICSSGARIILWNGSECIVQRASCIQTSPRARANLWVFRSHFVINRAQCPFTFSNCIPYVLHSPQPRALNHTDAVYSWTWQIYAHMYICLSLKNSPIQNRWQFLSHNDESA